MAQLLIKNGIVRTASTGKRESQLKLKGYTEFNPKKPTPAPKQEEAKTE
jgi:hypothetical protein